MKLPHTLSLLLASAAFSSAAVLYTTDFPDAANTIPSGWTVLAGGEGSTTTNGWYMDSDGGNYRFRTTISGTNALSQYSGSLAGGASSSALTDFTIETSFIRTGVSGGVGGLAGRIVDANNFYHARLFNDNQFQIYLFSSSGNTQLANFTLAPADIYTTGETWTISMTFNGSTISANLFNELDELVSTLSVTNTSLTSGSAGIRTQNGYAYDHFTISEIPEPSATMLGGFALLSAMAVRRRR